MNTFVGNRRDRKLASSQQGRPAPIASLVAMSFLKPIVLFGLVIGILFALVGCAATGGASSTSSKFNLDPKKEPSAGFLIAKDAFVKTTPVKTIAVSPNTAGFSAGFVPLVLLYASESTKNFLETGSVNAVHRILAWENVLKKYKIPFQIIASANQMDTATGSVLLLPSSVALSSQERQAIVNFRSRGGSVLVTWAAGIRDERGAWTGFDFMEQVLDTKIVGTSANDKDDNFLMIQGNSPINQSLAAGERIWTERAREWYPLRIDTKNPYLHLMDWSRSFQDKRVTAAGHFSERLYGSANYSRVVALGIPERLWLTADPKQLEAMAHNALTWLMRLPSATKSAWPKQYQSALMFAMDCAETLLDPDVAFLKKLDEAGVRATLYTLGDNAKKSAAKIQSLQQRGHELALAGDKFVGFAGQSRDVQAARLDSALEKFKEAGLKLPNQPSFHAPTESYDKTTEMLLRQRGFASYVAFQDAGEARLPEFKHQENTNKDTHFIALVRSQRGPEDATEEGDVDDGLKSFYTELQLAIQMRGLNVIRMPSQSLLTAENLEEIANEFKKTQSKVWHATASELTKWWIERERIAVNLDGNLGNPYLNVDITGTADLSQKIVVQINLPKANSKLSLMRNGQIESELIVNKLDNFTASVELPVLAPGNYRWRLLFQSAATSQ